MEKKTHKMKLGKAFFSTALRQSNQLFSNNINIRLHENEFQGANTALITV